MPLILTHLDAEYFESTDNSYFFVTGDTMKVKDELKNLGGRWCGEVKGWIFATTQLTVVERFALNFNNQESGIKEEPKKLEDLPINAVVSAENPAMTDDTVLWIPSLAVADFVIAMSTLSRHRRGEN